MKEQNSQYIVNLAEQIVGKQIISGLKDRGTTEPHDLLLLLSPQIQAKVEKMTPETLGRICACGFYPGGSRAREPLPNEIGFVPSTDFICGTGIRDVHPDYFGSGRSGRQLLEKIAIATIVATVNDIIHQEEYQTQRTED